ncbi:MAG: deoxyribodipyrimidine photo-lyase [Pseudomonadota bacterium]
MGDQQPVIWWVRKDLRLADNPALTAAIADGAPVIPLFIFDEVVERYGAAPKWRFLLGARAFAARLGALGSRLVFRRGAALAVLRDVMAETGARRVIWTRDLDPDAVARDTAVKSALKFAGIEARSVKGNLLFEPWTVATKTGGFYRVYTPFWKAVRDTDVPVPKRAPSTIPAPPDWPASDDPDTWDYARPMDRGAAVVAPHLQLGERAALERLETFIADWVADYVANRDRPAVPGTSLLSQNLAWGEIGPATCWHAGRRALEAGKVGAETFLKELVWREFAYHLIYHTPQIVSGNWRPEWDAFPWGTDASAPAVIAWRQGRTGLPFVDAAMREMYVTGTMHNRGRMIVASYLTKHLMTHWQIGKRWFEDCLVDWDPASNAMGWQWSAGSGPDATPYFRIFNPETQLTKFDPDAIYTSAWIAEGQRQPSATALSYFEAIPRSWQLSPSDPYPTPVVSAGEGRQRALAAYETRGF